MSEGHGETIVAAIPKRPGEEIRVAVKEFKGRMRINIRVWYQSDAGDWRPSMKGISLSPAQAADVQQALPKAQALAKAGPA